MNLAEIFVTLTQLKRSYTSLTFSVSAQKGRFVNFLTEKFICLEVVECIFPLKRIQQTHFFVKCFQLAFVARGFSTQNLMFVQMGSYLPTTSFHPPSWRAYPHSHAAFLPAQILLQIFKNQQYLENSLFNFKNQRKDLTNSLLVQ